MNPRIILLSFVIAATLVTTRTGTAGPVYWWLPGSPQPTDSPCATAHGGWTGLNPDAVLPGWYQFPANTNLGPKDIPISLAVNNSFKPKPFKKSITYSFITGGVPIVGKVGAAGNGIDNNGNGAPAANLTVADNPPVNPAFSTISMEFLQYQPAWETLTLVANAKVPLLDVKAFWMCYKAANPKTTCKKEITFGDEAGMLVTKLWEFPEGIPIDTTVAPTLDADPSTGNWSYQYVYADPFGNPMPNGGVEWTTDGAGISEDSTYLQSTTMVGGTATLYDDYFFDSTTGSIDYAQSQCPEPSTLLLLALGGLAMLRRHKA